MPARDRRYPPGPVQCLVIEPVSVEVGLRGDSPYLRELIKSVPALGTRPGDQLAEPARESHLPSVIQALSAEEDHLVRQHRSPDTGYRRLIQRPGQVHAADIRPDMPGYRFDRHASREAGVNLGHDRHILSAGSG